MVRLRADGLRRRASGPCEELREHGYPAAHLEGLFRV